MLPQRVVDLSFAGSGFLGMFHIGSLAAFRKHKSKVAINNCLGASSGALVACAAVADIDTAWVKENFRSTVKKSEGFKLGAFSLEFDVGCILRDALMEDLPEDICDVVNNKLYISLTTTGFKNVLVSRFSSKEDLVDALICSCFIPFFSGRQVPKYCGKKYLDGGFTNQLPVLGGETIKISPFSGKMKDICPRENSPLNLTMANENMFLNKNNLLRGKYAFSFLGDETLETYFKLGFNETELFIKNTLLRHPTEP